MYGIFHQKRGGTLRGGYGLKEVYDAGILILRKRHLLEQYVRYYSVSKKCLFKHHTRLPTSNKHNDVHHSGED